MDLSTYLLISIVYIPLNVFDLFIITRYMNTLYGLPRKGPYIKLLKIFRVNPKFCVNSISGANRAKFICGGSRLVRLPPCQQHNAGGGGCQGRRSRLFYP